MYEMEGNMTECKFAIKSDARLETQENIGRSPMHS